MNKIHPKLTYFRRTLRFPRLWRLGLFSTKLANELYSKNGRTTPFQVTPLPDKHKFHSISKALRQKKIEQIHFSGEFRVFLPKKDHIFPKLPEVIRIAVRELATFGIPKTAKSYTTFINDKKDKRRIRCVTTISPRVEDEVDIIFGIY